MHSLAVVNKKKLGLSRHEKQRRSDPLSSLACFDGHVGADPPLLPRLDYKPSNLSLSGILKLSILKTLLLLLKVRRNELKERDS